MWNASRWSIEAWCETAVGRVVLPLQSATWPSPLDQQRHLSHAEWLATKLFARVKPSPRIAALTRTVSGSGWNRSLESTSTDSIENWLIPSTDAGMVRTLELVWFLMIFMLLWIQVKHREKTKFYDTKVNFYGNQVQNKWHFRRLS